MKLACAAHRFDTTRLLIALALLGVLGMSACSEEPSASDESSAGESDDDDSADEGDDADDDDVDEDSSEDEGPQGSVDAGPGKVMMDGNVDGAKDGGAGPKLPDGGGTDASTSESDAGDPPAAPSRALCHLEGHEVAVLGDSYIHLSGDFTRLLQEKARAAGALDAGESYIDRSFSGTSMAGDWSLLPNIPTQFPDALAASKAQGGTIKVVIMTGGGNDVLVYNRACLEMSSAEEVAANPDCVRTVDEALKAGQDLFKTAVAAGVQATIYFFYPHLPEDSLGGGPKANNMLDYAAPRVQEFCESQTAAPCYFVDLREPFNDPQNDGWPRAGLIELDGIHPTAEGSKIMADEIWRVMQEQCLGVE